MIILEKGTPPEKRLWRGTCNRCKTRVEFEQGEGTFHDDQRDGAYVTVICPVCQHTIYGSEKR